MNFHVGQKVVCVDASPVPHGVPFLCVKGKINVSNGDMGGLTRGAVYTVSEIRSGAAGVSIILAEIYRTDGPITEPGFRAQRFRPIVEDKKKVSFTIGADPESERWDNRIKIPAKT